jgi:hypothetical protein
MPSDDRVALISGTHLTDDQLMETYVLATEDRHLAMCRPCRTRFEALERSLERLREDATREADHVFTPERLHDQCDRILRRLERHTNPAEILRFPNRTAGHPSVRRTLGPARRWVAGAAAAGLVAGLFLGFAMDRRVISARAAQRLRTVPVVTPQPLAWQQTADPGNEQLLSEIEDALMGSRVIELRALDAMTTPPEIQEASFDPR